MFLYFYLHLNARFPYYNNKKNYRILENRSKLVSKLEIK